jgi:hypothetical protein
VRGGLADHGFDRPPAAVISSATALAPSALTSVTATFAPSSANTRAVARPIPEAAPVTSAVNPFTERLSCLNSAMGGTSRNRLTSLSVILERDEIAL